jgi:hypothetical protein
MSNDKSGYTKSAGVRAFQLFVAALGCVAYYEVAAIEKATPDDDKTITAIATSSRAGTLIAATAAASIGLGLAAHFWYERTRRLR